jgi:hypothetical protein
VAVLLLGALLMGWGVHYLLENGNCSSTGYVSYGPVPTCHGQEGLYITSVFFLGPALAVVGWGLARISGIFATTVCVAWGVGLGTILLDPNAGSGAKASGLVGAVIFAALTVYSVYRTIRKRRQPTPVLPTTGSPATGLAGAGLADTGAGLAGTGLAGTAGPLTSSASAVPAMPSTGPPVWHGPAASNGPEDPLDKIARLAQLRDSGALTQEEFDREKAKLLGQL